MLIINTIESKESEDGVHAYIDSRLRSRDAIDAKPEFFLDKNHLAKVYEVSAIMKNFFKVHNGMYISQRLNRGKPFTAVKMNNPIFPNGMSTAEKTRLFYKPLEMLGVEVVFAAGTNSWICRVK